MSSTQALPALPVVVGNAIHRVDNGVFSSNCYVCATGVDGQCVVVDPGLDPAPIDAALAALGLVPAAVVCTHGHFDHTGSAAHLQALHSCPVYLHERDLKTLKSSNFLMMAFKIPARMKMPSVSAVTDDEPTVRLAHTTLRYHPAPGHTPGSCLVQWRNTLFTGDTLYSRGVGLSKLPGEDAPLLRRSIGSLWDAFPDDTLVCPGHGDVATLGWIKANNVALLRFMQAADSTGAVA